MEEVQRIKRQGSESRQACLDGRVAMELDKVNLNDYTQIGEGGNGKTYVSSAAPDEILKVNNARLSTWEAVKHEYDVSKAVASLGIPVPAMYRIVQVGDAYATISQRIAALDVVLRTVFQKPNFVEKLFFGIYIHKLMKQYYS